MMLGRLHPTSEIIAKVGGICTQSCIEYTHPSLGAVCTAKHYQ